MRNKLTNMALLAAMAVASGIFVFVGLNAVYIIILLGGWASVLRKVVTDTKK